MRIDDHNFWFAQVTLASEGIKSNRGSGCIVFDAMKVSPQKFSKGNLAALRDIDQLAELINEQIDPVSFEPLLRQRMLRGKMSLKTIDCFSDFT